ncbi:MAG: LacI family DNA-binding transcriptional regulator [Proteobacteria bacterium]|nr:LacI family DNA-binding transcriptional regulator [Pseudomonadota bacterium]
MAKGDTSADGGSWAGEGVRRRPTINDIARLAGVSKKTVSRVINASPDVQKATRERIQAVIDEQGFEPDPRARGLASRHAYLVGFVYDDDSNSQYVVNMQLGLLDGLKGSGFELVVHPCHRGNPAFLSDLRTFVERQRLFGVVVTPSVSEDSRVVMALAEIGCAYVLVSPVGQEAPEHSIETYDRLGGALAAGHLARLGHRRIAHISGSPAYQSAPERRAGFEAGLAAHGLALEPRYVRQGDYTFEAGLAGAIELLQLEPRPTAIFAGSDEIAAGVLRAAHQAGLRVPRDLSVVGFDDFDIAPKVWPGLTTVRRPLRELGRLAADKLLNPAAGAAGHDHAPALVVRESCGPAPNA